MGCDGTAMTAFSNGRRTIERDPPIAGESWLLDGNSVIVLRVARLGGSAVALSTSRI
jgi:hypothetical protein